MKNLHTFAEFLNENLHERINSSDPFTDAFSNFCVEVMKETKPLGLLLSQIREAGFQFILHADEHGLEFDPDSIQTEKDLEKLRDLINSDGLGDTFDSYKMKKGEFFERYKDFFYRKNRPRKK